MGERELGREWIWIMKSLNLISIMEGADTLIFKDWQKNGEFVFVETAKFEKIFNVCKCVSYSEKRHRPQKYTNFEVLLRMK